MALLIGSFPQRRASLEGPFLVRAAARDLCLGGPRWAGETTAACQSDDWRWTQNGPLGEIDRGA